MQKLSVCPATWFSGFFGLGAVVHLVRLIFQIPVRVGSFEVPLSLSLLAVVILGSLSVGLLYLAMKRPCCLEGRQSHGT